MSGLPSDYSLIGIVLAISLAIILLSGIALYVAFRIRETLREEHGRGARIAKIAFLISLLFLSGGIFYFFAAGFNSLSSGESSSLSSTVTSSGHSSSISSSSASIPSSSSSTTGTQTTASSSSSSGSSTQSSGTSSSVSSSETTSSSSSIQGGLSLSTSFPSTETKGSSFYGTFTIVNNASIAAGSATIQLGNLMNQFAFQACSISVNGGGAQNCNSSVSGNVISLGSIAPGTTVISLQLVAPPQPGQISDTVTLYYQLGTQHSLVATISIHIIA